MVAFIVCECILCKIPLYFFPSSADRGGDSVHVAVLQHEEKYSRFAQLAGVHNSL